MSGPGQGYARGPPAQYAFAQPQHTSQRDPYAPAGGAAPDPRSSAHSQHFGGSPYQEHHGHSLSTVSEKEEPAPSPQMGRNDRGFGSADGGDPYAHQQYGQYGQGQQQSQQYDYGYEAQPDYGDQGAYPAYDQQQEVAGADVEPQQQQATFEAPYYPGWIYNSQTNSYDPDPNYTPDEAGAADLGQDEGDHQLDGQQQAAKYDNGFGYVQQTAQHGYSDFGQQYDQENEPQQQNQQQPQNEYFGGDSHDASEQPLDAYGGSNDPYGQSQHNAALQPSNQEQDDPYANDPYAMDPYADDGYAEGYGTYTPGQQPQGDENFDAPTPHAERHDPYAADSNPYAEDEQQADPFAQVDAQDPYAATGAGQDGYYGAPAGRERDAYAPAQQENPYDAPTSYDGGQQGVYEPYGQQGQPAQASREAGEQQQPSWQQTEAYDPYAPRAPAAAAQPKPAPRAAPPPSSARTAYSPPLAQQQFTSFAAFAQPDDSNPPHDPYAPTRTVPQQQRRQQPAYDPYASPTLQKDAFDGYASQRSPPLQQQQLPQAYQAAPPPERAVASPPSRTTALSPPPRSSSAASGTSTRQPASSDTNAPPQRATPAAPSTKRNVPAPLQATPARTSVEPAAPSPKQTTPSQMASPRAEAAAALASPPPRSRPLPSQAQKKQQQSSGAAFDVPPPRNAPPPRPQPVVQQQQEEPRAPPPVSSDRHVPSQDRDERRMPPQRKPVPSFEPPPQTAASRAPASSPYAPPPSKQPVLPPTQRRTGPGSASGLRPPVARAPHQRGASAFGSDSPYGALPAGPLTSSYEPPQTVDEHIKEEEVEEEVSKAPKDEEEDHVPSWMQATTPAARPPPFPQNDRSERVAPKQEEQEPRIPLSPPANRNAPVPAPRRSQPDLADDLAALSLNRDGRSQGMPPPRTGAALPPVKQSQQAGPPPPRGAGGPQPPRSTAGPGSAARSGPSARAAANQQPQLPQQQAQVRAAPLPKQQGPVRPPLQQQKAHSGPPAASQLPTSPDRGHVPKLHVEAPSPEIRPDRRNDPYGYTGGRSSPMPMAGIEETPEPSEHEDSYGGATTSEDQATRTGESQSGGDDSIVYHPHEDDQTGLTTPSSQYGGEWRADSEESQGYDYISSGYQAQQPPRQQLQQSRAYDPYAPPAHQQSQRDPYARGPSQGREAHSRESTFTPPAQDQRRGPTQYAASPRKAVPLQPPAASSMARANSYDAPPSRPIDSYSPYASAPAPAQREAQQQPYNPYAPQPPAPISRPGSAMAGPPADLGLERRTAPIASFGFGGKLVLVFPNGGRPSYGMDSSNPYGVAASGGSESSPTMVHIRKLANIASSVMPSEGGSTFPGPIFCDGGKANAGKKRKEAVAWLSQRIADLEQEAQYARRAGPPGLAGSDNKDARRKVETRLLLVKLVRIMIENEGKLIGTPAVDDAVRALFAPGEVDDSGALPTADQLAAAASRGPSGSDAPFVSYGVSASNLDDMSKFLLRGERREAVNYALDNKMWAHAFIIASCVDTDCWKDVTVEFLRSELSPESSGSGAEGREALRVAYGMFAGLGAESIHQFIPPRALGPSASGLLPAAPVGNGATSTPVSRVPSDTGAKLPETTLAKWHETVGMIVANRTVGDSGALTSLGDALAANGWTDAAHICYLLSPQTSLAMGFGLPGSRVTLIGSSSTGGDGSIELESVQLTELVEFALSLVPTVKGQEPFAGLPHLQAFRLYHAAALADAGHATQAHKYTEAIVNTLKLATKPSPFYHPRLVAQIKALSERLGASHNVKEGGSWITRKVPRPTVNSLWSTFEGGFNKFVAGDDDPTAQQLAAKAEVQKATGGQAVSAFSHFSSIAPGSNSGTLSRAQSSTDLAGSNYLHVNPPARPMSAQRASSPLAAPAYHHQPHQSPGPPPVKRAPFKTHHARSSSLGAFAGYDYNPTAPPPAWLSSPTAVKRGDSNGDAGAEGGPQIADNLTDSPRRDHRDHGPTSARRPQFAAVDEQLHEDESGFISPMAHLTPSVSPAPPASRSQQTHRRMTTAEELADLGLANNKSKKPAFDTLDEELEAEEGGVTPTKEKPEESTSTAEQPSTSARESKPGSNENEKPTIKPSKSWLGGWFKREASPANGPGPVRANLGEKTSLYYDENLKRWITKGEKIEAPPTVMPPPRAATASPSKTMRNNSPRFDGDNVPPVPSMPPRSATTGPPPMSSGPPTRPPSAGGMPPRSGGATPVDGAPARGPRKNKARYVVVAP